mgnify:CR=1 FL=1
MSKVSDIKIADLVAWKVESHKSLKDTALVMSVSDNELIEGQFAKVVWNTGNISNVPIKLIYVVNRSI